MSEENKMIRVGFVGNPNCGKTTLFNAFTGAKLKVANWPGVTVERVEGMTSYKGCSLRMIDTPGIYSLTCYTIEEKVTRKCLEDGEVDAGDLARTAFILGMDTKTLCSEDCKGLCPRCGADLNLGPCSCGKETDPRLAVLAKLLENRENE